ncbi:MAG: hypothetical protein HDQ89_00060 [Desulfovibrio sp.]|nr:hypothetical protein [Desulfovibrio sp.]
MPLQLHRILRTLLLAPLLLAAGCSGDEPAATAGGTPDADVLGVLGVPAAPGGTAAQSGPKEAGAAGTADKARENRTPPEAAPAGQSLKVEVSAPRFASDKQAPAPTPSATPGGALDY